MAVIDLDNNDAGGGDLLDRAQQWDLETLLAEGLLTKADRASMSSALELRAPFLDEAVMEFAKSLRVEDRVRGFKTKVFLKRYARRYLPNNIVNRRKRGLSVPISSWLRGPLKEWATATLENGRLEQRRHSRVRRLGIASPNIASAKPTMPAPFGPCSFWGNGWTGWRRKPRAYSKCG